MKKLTYQLLIKQIRTKIDNGELDTLHELPAADWIILHLNVSGLFFHSFTVKK